MSYFGCGGPSIRYVTPPHFTSPPGEAFSAAATGGHVARHLPDATDTASLASETCAGRKWQPETTVSERDSATTPAKPAAKGDGHDHGTEAAAGHPDGGGAPAAVRPREIFFMAATGILALLLLLGSLRRRQPAGPNDELS